MNGKPPFGRREKNEIPAFGRHEILPNGSMKYPYGA